VAKYLLMERLYEEENIVIPFKVVKTLEDVLVVLNTIVRNEHTYPTIMVSSVSVGVHGTIDYVASFVYDELAGKYTHTYENFLHKRSFAPCQ
jgi:hypothetical protein